MTDTTLTSGDAFLVKEKWTPPLTLMPGPEMEALKKFHFDCRWTGTVKAGGMGPNSPEMEVKGKGTFRPIMDGLWLVGDFEQAQLVQGEVAVTWKAHYIVGWSSLDQKYKIALVDSNSVVGLMTGRIESNKFIAETDEQSPVKLQMVWELMADGSIKWANRCLVDGGLWFLIEEYLCTPL